jgi:hypothetical protein
MIVVQQLPGKTRVKLVSVFDNMTVHGGRDYLPSQPLFGKPAREVEDGVYDDEGKNRVPFLEWLTQRAKEAGVTQHDETVRASDDDPDWVKGSYHGWFAGSRPHAVGTTHVLTAKAILAEPWAQNVKPFSAKIPEIAKKLDQRAKNILQRELGMSQITFENHNDKTDEYLANALASDLKNDLHNGQSSDTWYSDKMKEAMGIAERLHPEIATSADHRFAYTIGLTVASQGERIDRVCAMAEDIYDHFEKHYDAKTGRSEFPTKMATANPDINENLDKLNRLVKGFGSVAKVKEFFDTEFTVKELEQYTGKVLEGKGFVVGKTNKDDKVYGSAVLGPKIGQGFYQNLNGNFKPLTMDLWFMRGWGRLTGTLIGDVDMGPVTERFQKALKAAKQPVPRGEERTAERAREVYAEHERRFHSDPAYRARPKSELALASQAYVYNHDNGMVETPRGGTERVWIRNVFNRAIGKLADQGIHLTPAAAQATWWTPEQELYKALGGRVYNQSRDYAEGLRKIAKARGINA